MTIFEDINNGKYENKMDYAKLHTELADSKAELTRLGMLYNYTFDFSSIASNSLLAVRHEIMKVVRVSLLPYEQAKTNMDAYHQESNRLNVLFREDLKEEFGTQNSPKEPMLFEKAWDRGHSSGLYEVALAYSDLVELIQ